MAAVFLPSLPGKGIFGISGGCISLEAQGEAVEHGIWWKKLLVLWSVQSERISCNTNNFGVGKPS